MYSKARKQLVERAVRRLEAYNLSVKTDLTPQQEAFIKAVKQFNNDSMAIESELYEIKKTADALKAAHPDAKSELDELEKVQENAYNSMKTVRDKCRAVYKKLGLSI